VTVNGGEQVGTLALVGPGRAGTTIAAGLAARGWQVGVVVGSGLDSASARAAAGRLGARVGAVEEVVAADLVIIATPDASIGSVATRLASCVRSDQLVIHLSGARGIGALAEMPCRIGALHPLQTLPTVDLGLARLPGSWCAIAGDPQVAVLAEQLGLRPVSVSDADRARYHATACIASNHLVALLGQVERVAPVPLEALLPLVRASVDNVADLGAARALTGPVARGDVETVRAHLEALPPNERDGYRALARLAYELAGRGTGAADAELAAVLQ
jgi:predicted short-subunit dehydrogenase-like oxidoreductase (DUF2520 family)